MNAIETDKLSKCYRKKTALSALDLSIREGELFSLLGVNGAGKSTAIKLLSCLTRPTEGDAHLMGHSILTARLAVKEIINVSPQETAIAPNLTVRENLELICGIYGQSGQESRRRTEAMMETLGLSTLSGTRAKTLSGGWQRRLSIAMALISEPKILFLDEPTLGLDVLAQRELWSFIRTLKGKVTILLTTHYLEEAEALSDRIGILWNGVLQAVGTVDALKTLSHTTTLEDAFVALAADGGRSA